MAPESYFLIGLKNYSATGTSPEADWLIISTTIQLSNETGAIGIFYQDPSQFASSSQALEQKIDLLSWKESQNSQEPLVKETGSAIASSENQSLTRRQWQGSYIDTDNNSFDFEISQPGPVNSKGLPPQKITELKIASSSCNTIALSWPQGADPDTPTQELSYVVYYSRSAPLDENSLNASSTLSTTTASTTISLSDLYYNSNYYFGLKVFDGYNLSPLSNIASTSIDSALNDSPWPFWRQNLQRQGQNQYSGPNATPSVFWIYKKESSSKNPNNNPLYSPVVIKPEGAIIASVIYPQNKKGVLVLGPDGEKKWFSRDNEPGTYLKLLPDGSVASDNYSLAWSEDEMFYYLSQEDTLSAFDKQGNKQWERSFDFIMPQGQPCASTTPSLLPPLIGKDGKIYLVVKNNSCNSEYKLDYLYTISPENGSDFLEPISLGGYKSSLPAIGPNNTLYLFNLTYPKYSCQPKLWLRAVSNNSISWSKYFNNSFNSPPIVDSQGNLYFVIGKTLWAFNKNGEKLWDLYFGADLFSNWDKTDEIGISLSKKGTLYISGRGAILAIK